MPANQQQLFVSSFSVSSDTLRSPDIMQCKGKTVDAYETGNGSNDSSKK
jgi:hypothetical protein